MFHLTTSPISVYTLSEPMLGSALPARLGGDKPVARTTAGGQIETIANSPVGVSTGAPSASPPPSASNGQPHSQTQTQPHCLRCAYCDADLSYSPSLRHPTAPTLRLCPGCYRAANIDDDPHTSLKAETITNPNAPRESERFVSRNYGRR